MPVRSVAHEIGLRAKIITGRPGINDAPGHRMTESLISSVAVAPIPLTVREMQLAEVDIRINYFHDASDEYLRLLGVDRLLLPTRESWRAFYREDYARPIRERANYSLVWQQDGQVVGFSSTDRIDFGNEAFMHLHVVKSALRSTGLGTQFVRLSANAYFEALELKRLFCEPNAFNIAPNRTLQRAGFRYLFTHEAQPSSINFPQVTTRWVLERPQGT
jgi:RimJ/RimL family protein N-acetyltransferase